jgi:hypothetical protein
MMAAAQRGEDVAVDQIDPGIDLLIEEERAIGIAAGIADVEADSRSPAAWKMRSEASSAARSMLAVMHSTPAAPRSSVASSSNGASRRAMRMRFTPSAAICRANSRPVPSDAPAIIAQGPYFSLKLKTSSSHACLILSGFDSAGQAMHLLQFLTARYNEIIWGGA